MLSRVGRLSKIVWVTYRFGLTEYITQYMNQSQRTPPWWVRLIPQRHFDTPLPVRLRLALESLGPIFIKFGQMLSTRRDIISDELSIELCKLQDQVPPFPEEDVRTILQSAYGEDISAVFPEFDMLPVASASIAQVHAARLNSGEKVAVKLLRPNMKATIENDLALLDTAASVVERVWPDGKRVHPREVVAEAAKVIRREQDLRLEAGNASVLRRHFADETELLVPEVFWDHCRSNVLVMTWMQGLPIAPVSGLVSAGVDVPKLAALGVKIFFEQVFRDGFFHADMHPGNMMIAPDGRYIALDFGIVGTLSDQTKRYLAENLIGFFHRDYRRVAEAHIEAGWAPEDTPVEDFEAAIRSICEPIFDRPLSQISFGRFLLQLFQVSKEFNIEVQPELVLLQKTLLQVEGLGRQLAPDLDLWATAKPFLEKWMSQQVGVRSLIDSVKRESVYWGRLMPQLPRLMHQAFTQINQPAPPPPPVMPSWLQRMIAIGIVCVVSLLIAIAAGIWVFLLRQG